jgi:hypothetical protein
MGSSNWAAGNSLYFGIAVDQYNADCARYVSYNRPFINRLAVSGGYGAVQWSTFFTGEYGMLRFVERNGIDVKYYGCIDAAGDSSGTLLKGNGSTVGGVKAGIFTGHNEYWSDGMRAGWEAFKVAGGSVFSCAGNEVFWRTVGSNNDSSGRPRTWECYKSTIAARASTGRTQWTGTWRDPDGAGKGGNNPENQFSGTIFMVNGPDFRSFIVPFTGGYSAQPLWRNTTVAALASGSYTSPSEILGFEWDTYGPAGTTATGNAFLATPHPRVRYCSTATHVVSNSIVLTDAGDTYSTGTVTHRLVAQPSSNNGGITFGTGTVNWAFGVDNTNTYHTNTGGDNVDVVIQQATINILCDMGVTAQTLMSGLTAPTAVDWFPSGAATLTVGSSLTAGASAVAVQGAATLAAGSTLSVSAVRTTAGAVILNASTTLSVAATLEQFGSVALSSTSSLTVAGLRTTTGAVSVLAVPVLTVTSPVGILQGAIGLAALGILMASVGGIAGAVTLPAIYVLAVNGTREKIGAALLTTAQALSVVGVLGAFGAAQLNVLPGLTVNVITIKVGNVTLTVLGVLTADGARLALGAVSLIALPMFAYVEMFPEVDFAIGGTWSTGGVHPKESWTTDGIHAGSVLSWS